VRDRKRENMQEKRWEWGGGENLVIWTLAQNKVVWLGSHEQHGVMSTHSHQNP